MLEHERQTNKPIDATPLPMKLVTSLISTQRGWMLRKSAHYANVGAAMATTWLAALGAKTDQILTVEIPL